MITRRSLLEAAGTTALLAGAGQLHQPLVAKADEALNLSPTLPAGTRAEAVLDTLPGKKPLIKRFSRAASKRCAPNSA
jgi:hypothetical protein